jgi:hypothetical protein
MYTRLNGMGWYPRRLSSVIPRAFDTGVDHTTLSTPGVLCPRFSVTRRTANALPLNERVRNLCKAFTLRQFRSFVALAIRICRFRTFPVTVAQSMPCHSIRSAEDADAGLSTRHFLSSNCMLTCCLLEESQARRRKSPPAGDIAFPAGKIHRNFYKQTARRDHVEVSPLARGVTFKPLSRPLQPGVRFFHHPLPAFPTAPLAIGLPAPQLRTRAEIRAYPVPLQQQEQLRSCLSTGGAYIDVSLPMTETSGRLPFWFGRISLQPPGFDNGVYRQFTYVDPTVQPSPLSVCNERTHSYHSRGTSISMDEALSGRFARDRYQSRAALRLRLVE